MNQKISYIAFYDRADQKTENRLFVTSSVAKIDYICSALQKNGNHVEIISPSWTLNKSGVFRGSIRNLEKDISLRLFSTFGGSTRPFKLAKQLWSILQLLFFMVRTLHGGETIILYHSPMLALPILLLKAMKPFRLVLELEEKYQDAGEMSLFSKIVENAIIQLADSFILATELLLDSIPPSRPCIICNGSYSAKACNGRSKKDSRIHVVYAGTFSSLKGGVMAAISASDYLPSNYHLHIIGFGSRTELDKVKKNIAVKQMKVKCGISYDGLLYGENYERFLQCCDIGLSTQTPELKYNGSSFPSKILSYLANGLQVVSVRIRAVEVSAIGEIVHYYEGQEPKSIADAIMSIKSKDASKGIELLSKLDKDFVISIGVMLSKQTK